MVTQQGNNVERSNIYNICRFCSEFTEIVRIISQLLNWRAFSVDGKGLCSQLSDFFTWSEKSNFFDRWLRRTQMVVEGHRECSSFTSMTVSYSCLSSTTGSTKVGSYRSTWYVSGLMTINRERRQPTNKPLEIVRLTSPSNFRRVKGQEVKTGT